MRKYIAGIAQAAVTQEEQANNIRDSAKATSNAIAAQLKSMSEQITQLTKNLDNKEKAAAKMHILDNKCSAEFKEQIKSNNMQYQLVPPYDHRRNIAAKAIQVFKAHFISILCGADKSSPLHLWDRLLGQAEHTLNIAPYRS